MKKKVLWITRTAVMLALLVATQAVTASFGQLVTGSCVNGILAVCVLMVGLKSGLTVALISPVVAYMLGIAPQVLVVPAIMLGNAAYVTLLFLIARNACGYKMADILRKVLAWLVAAAAKFAVMYTIVVWVVCNLLRDRIVASGVKPPVLDTKLPQMFSFPQLITALIGGGVALLILPVLRKAVRK